MAKKETLENVQEKMVINGRNMKITSGPVGTTASVGSRVFDVFNYLIIGIISITTILPFIYVLGASFATEYELQTRPMFLIPHDITVNAYRYIFSSSKLIRSFGNSVFITKHLRGRNVIMNLVIFSMFFSGGMIPSYLVTATWLGLKETYWAILLPGAISAYNMMIVKNFFQGIPQELEESAHLDGCTDISTLIRIVLPLSMPVLATFGLFYAVGHWNSYFSAMIYLTKNDKMWPLQLILRQIIVAAEAAASDTSMTELDIQNLPEQSVKMAVIVVSTFPIMCVYPFLQKYFVKGVMVGALKG